MGVATEQGAADNTRRTITTTTTMATGTTHRTIASSVPDRTRYRGEWYDRTGDCPTHLEGGAARAGEMWTALEAVDRPTIYVSERMTSPEQPPTIAVRVGGCFDTYDLQGAPGP
jgi:hypothetical protein